MKQILFAAALAGAVTLASCGDNKGGAQIGSLSKFDSLSYAVGVDMGTGLLKRQMADVPLDVKAIDKGIVEGFKNDDAELREKDQETLRTFFMMTRRERAAAIAKKRAEADSIRLASGDSTKMEWPAADPEMFASEEERESISLALGHDIGASFRDSKLPIRIVWLGQAIKDIQDGNPRIGEEEAAEFLRNYVTVTYPAECLAASQAWLAKVEKKSGVKKTESGLLYKVIEAGDAEAMPADDRDEVTVHYTGRTRDGKVFDTSLFANRPEEFKKMMREQRPDMFDEQGNLKEGDQPASFRLNGVIKGWTEGLKLVGKGGKIMLWIPADLAYGAQAVSREIGPNEALEFEVELLDVVPFEQPAPAEEAAETAEPAE